MHIERRKVTTSAHALTLRPTYLNSLYPTGQTLKSKSDIPDAICTDLLNSWKCSGITY